MPVFWSLIVFGVIFWLLVLRSLPSHNIQENIINKQFNDNSFIVPSNNITWDIANNSTWADIEKWEFNFIWECEPSNNTSEYKLLNVFSQEKRSPLDPKDYANYTTLFTIKWKINTAKLCIVADVVDYRKKHQFTYSTYILFSSTDYAGHINVGYSPKNWVVYDYTSSPREPFLDGRFWWDESPKIYNLDLAQIRVANPEDKWWKRIYPIQRLQKQWPVRIWWFVNAKNGEGIIQKFIIAYKCEDWSDCKIE